MTAPPAEPIPWQGAEFPPRQWQAECLPLAIDCVALDLLIAYLLDVHRRLMAAGIVGEPKYAPGGWQLADVSEKQVQAIKNAGKLTRHVPGQCRPPIKQLVKVPWALTRALGPVWALWRHGGGPASLTVSDSLALGRVWRAEDLAT